MDKYDVIIIGGGPAGYRAAERLAALKKKVCIAEFSEARIGGACLNEGCVPVKAMVESAHLLMKMRRSSEFGIESGEIKADMGAVRAAASKKMDFLRTALYSSLKKQGVDFVFGAASFVSANVIKIDSRQMEAEYFIIASGSESRKLRLQGFELTMNSFQLLEKGFSGNELLIVGGGYIGCEFASLYRAFGRDVTVLEALPDLLAVEDSDVTRALEREFKKQGITLLKAASLKSVSSAEAGLSARIEQNGRSSEEKFDAVLSAVGRRPMTEELNLGSAGVNVLPSGAIAVDDSMRTNVPNIYAAGDVIDSPMLAHTAYREGVTAASAIAGLETEKINYPAVPRIVFSFPQVGALGITEKEASSRGIETETRKSFFAANAKAVITGETAGLLKIISSVSDGRILGAAAVGAQACEIIHLLSPAVSRSMTLKQAAEVMYGHPTLSEIVSEALAKI